MTIDHLPKKIKNALLCILLIELFEWQGEGAITTLTPPPLYAIMSWLTDLVEWEDDENEVGQQREVHEVEQGEGQNKTWINYNWIFSFCLVFSDLHFLRWKYMVLHNILLLYIQEILSICIQWEHLKNLNLQTFTAKIN